MSADNSIPASDSLSDLVPGDQSSVEDFFSWVQELHLHHDKFCRDMKAALSSLSFDEDIWRDAFWKMHVRAKQHVAMLDRCFQAGQSRPNPLNCFGSDIIGSLGLRCST